MSPVKADCNNNLGNLGNEFLIQIFVVYSDEYSENIKMRLILSLRVLSKAVRIIVFQTCLESGLHMLLSVFNSVKKHWTQTKLRQRMLQSESCLASTGCALSTTEDVENVPYSLLPQPIFSFKFENC